MMGLRLDVDLRPKASPRPRGKQGQRAYFGEDYERWRESFGWLIKEQLAHMPHPPLPLAGDLELQVILAPTRVSVELAQAGPRPGRLTGDLDNYAKSVADVLQTIGVIGNDRQITRLVVSFED